MRRCVLLLVLLAAAGCATAGVSPPMTRQHAGSLFQVSDQGLFGVEMIFPGNQNVLRKGENRLEVVIRDRANRGVKNARLSLEPRMPMQGIGSSRVPVVSEMGQGRYALSVVDIPREGHWQLKLGIASGLARDTVVFDFPGMRGAPEGAGTPGAAAEEAAPAREAGPDVSTIRISVQNAFMASYESATQTVSPGVANAWLLTVRTLDGSPVPVAVIKVDASMPEGGRSMSRKPEVTGNLGEGVYRVEGFSFDEPGWWQVRFTIKAMGKEDAAIFNLVLP